MLNELYAEGKIIKINTRPVYFIDREVYESNPSLSAGINFDKVSALNDRNDPFNKLIGSGGSLKEHVKMCKSAATYPPDGLPILLLGNTGTGKSFMAQLIYEYAKYKGVIGKSAPYVIFNCAEYANNPELLSANLFGYVKGAFTGADKDKPGLLEEADGGYLFLDEVHRLPPEGQEKLFLLLDKGIFRRLGETMTWRSAKVRFIFATTEDPSVSLINTFLRRIPLVVNIPALPGRPISEKLQMIYSFYQCEARKIDIDIMVSRQVVSTLLNANTAGNIGKLINAVKYSCALAYDTASAGRIKMLRIHLHDLPEAIRTQMNFTLADNTLSALSSNLSSMFIPKDNQRDYYNNAALLENSKTYKETERLLKCIRDYREHDTGTEAFRKMIISDFNKILDEIIYKNIDNCQDTVFNDAERVIQNILGAMENLYGIRYYGNAAVVFISLINLIHGEVAEKLGAAYNLDELNQTLKGIFPKEYLIGRKILELIEMNLDMSINPLILIIFTLYVKTFYQDCNAGDTTAIIICRGYSTASSIASVANRLLEQFIFEAFDIPIEMSAQELTHKICDYLKNIDTSHGVMLLVDMGSPDEIYDSVKEIVEGDVGVINNISTQLAINVGSGIKSGESMEKVIVEAVQKNDNLHEYIRFEKNKKDAIIVTCMTGIGMAAKLRDLFAECLANSDIEIVAYDYNRLRGNGAEDEIFKSFNVKIIIGTSNPGIRDTNYISLEELILGKGYKKFKKALSGN
ncbi:MAG TPA: sigma 54-interacting transcriptional regulator, partial [Bacillota bacterium]|nr:sigma 54-interacting transcriptional regulator [Bacillota bacterium]